MHEHADEPSRAGSSKYATNSLALRLPIADFECQMCDVVVSKKDFFWAKKKW